MSDPAKKARALALEALRQNHLEDLEAIYKHQFDIVMDPDTKPGDVNNGVKNLLTLHGVGRVAPEKPPEAPKTTAPAEQTAPISDERMADILAKLAK